MKTLEVARNNVSAALAEVQDLEREYLAAAVDPSIFVGRASRALKEALPALTKVVELDGEGPGE